MEPNLEALAARVADELEQRGQARVSEVQQREEHVSTLRTALTRDFPTMEGQYSMQPAADYQAASFRVPVLGDVRLTPTARSGWILRVVDQPGREFAIADEAQLGRTLEQLGRERGGRVDTAVPALPLAGVTQAPAAAPARFRFQGDNDVPWPSET